MLKAVLIDDEYYERLSLKNTIPWKELGIQIIGEANNGLAALDMICKSLPDIAVIDINMPKLNGIELITKLNKSNISCQYIILTGYDEFKYAQQAISLNVSDYILKPINYTALIDSLKKIRSKIEVKEKLSFQLSELQNENLQFQQERFYNDLTEGTLFIQDAEKRLKNLPENFFLNFNSYQIAVLGIPLPIVPEDLYLLKEKIAKTFHTFSFAICIDSKKRMFFVLNGEYEAENLILIEKIMQFARQEGFFCKAGIGNIVKELFQISISYHEALAALKKHPISISKEESDSSDTTKRAEAYILKYYYDSELSISSIAKALYTNYSYLCYCFKRDKQMTINDYIRKIRIQKAIELFSDGIENIAYVAEKTGFTSASYFSKQFKKATGIPPSEYLLTIKKF